ncbi:Ubiquitin carboxyl-terminal hydrolase CYLD [Folsomia candida]|uniref:Ubiquitin carboxyl-terminal hydrolase CYLD n=1 Tax=Folsomia candida TaxID=158441 RepID=A0A226EHU1_FOLCA|nr:Ubiquitin carboxyl-terminal hydrolase CYLD [Folsomia candida]
MGLFDCVSDNSGKYPVKAQHRHQAPLERGMSGRRSMGIFASNASLKGKDTNFWRHRLLCFLYKGEGREDVGSLHMPLKQMGYTTIGDFIRDIPAEVYEPYKAQLNPDTTLRKDYKVIWERDGIAEPGIIKWEGSIEGQRCMGLQLDRKKAVPFGIVDGKGLFYCKPGHRALVSVDEVFAYKAFLRQFIGLPPRKDSMPLNLLPGRSAVRVAVAKRYKPGDRVHLPTEGKWATILWTGRIDDEWVVDLVYDPEKPTSGKIVSPDEPYMSRSLSMAEFIDELGPKDEKSGSQSRSQSSPTPPRHVPPPPPTTPPPKSPDLEDEVFIALKEKVVVSPGKTGTPKRPPPQQQSDDDHDNSGSESQLSEGDDDEEDSATEESDHSESDHAHSEHAIELARRDEDSRSETDEEDETHLHRAHSEPGQDLYKLESKQKAEVQKGLEQLEQAPLKSKPTHKPMFNLASLGRKKKTKEKTEPKVQVVAPVLQIHTSPKREFGFFSKNKSKSKQIVEPESVIKRLGSSESQSKNSPADEPSFMRKDRSPSPVHRRPDKVRLSSDDHHRELPVDVPSTVIKSPKRSVTETMNETLVRPSANQTQLNLASPQRKNDVAPTSSNVQPTRKHSSDSFEESSEEESVQTNGNNKEDVPVSLPLVKNKFSEQRQGSDQDSDTTPPYSPAIKDVGFKFSKPATKENKSPFRSFGGIFSKQAKPLPPKDYTTHPKPPVRNESLEQQDNPADTDSISHASEDSRQDQVGRKLSNENGQSSFFRRKPKRQSNIEPTPMPTATTNDVTNNPSDELSSTEQMGDQEFLVLDSLEVKHDDQQPPWNSPPPQSTPDANTPKRKGSKGKTFSFGFSSSKKQKPTTTHDDITKDSSFEGAEMVAVIEDTPRYPTEPKSKPKSSLRDSFTRTFSFTKSKGSSMERRDSLGDRLERRPDSLYIDNNEALGATNISRPKSKSASVLVDIQPWNDRRGYKSEIHDIYDSQDESPHSPGSPRSVPALQPKQPDPTIPKHRIFTTPIGLFGFGHKSNDETTQKPKKKTSFKESKLPKPIRLSTSNESRDVPSPVITVKPTTLPKPVSRPTPPSQPPPPIPTSDEPLTPSSHNLKSAMKQRKEIDAIPKGVKIGDRVIWYNGATRTPIPGFVKKLYKDGTDKYTAVVKFDRVLTSEPLTLAREGDDYVITVEELITPEILGLPLSPSADSPKQQQNFQEPVVAHPQSVDPIEINQEPSAIDEECKSPTVRFVPSPDPPVTPVPEINIELASPVSPSGDEDADRIPPPFQEEEVEVACGVRRGIPSRDRTCCVETILFAMFYATNTFDTSLLYGSSFEQDKMARDIRILLRDGIVHPLRQSGYCEWVAVRQLKELLQNASPDFNSINSDAEVMTLVLFDRALKVGKFISYSNGMTDYMHQLVLDPRDLCKSGTVQQLLENSLTIMESSKFKTPPSPALIIEIPRNSDKLVHYEAVIPNLTINVSQFLENGPRLCICGMVATYECLQCTHKSSDKALVYCDNCASLSDQIHFQLAHDSSLVEIIQTAYSMDLVAVICVKAGHYTSFVKCGLERASPWLFYDAAEIDNPKVTHL